MKIDVDELTRSVGNLKYIFGQMFDTMDSIINNNKTICDNANLDSNYKDAYYEAFKNMMEKFDVIKNKCNNTLSYLNTVIYNYSSLNDMNKNTFAIGEENE